MLVQLLKKLVFYADPELIAVCIRTAESKVFHNTVMFYHEEFSPIRLTLEDYPFSVSTTAYAVYSQVPHIWRPSPVSATRTQHAVLARGPLNTEYIKACNS
jgi:hypothetical protein